MIARGIITTVAGGGDRERRSNGERATEVKLKHPSGVTVDHAGCVLIADSNANAIVKLDRSGMLSTVAGGNGMGYGGDGGPAVAAQLALPTCVVMDGGGNVFIADRDNDAIRRIDETGTITSIAGGRGRGASGDRGLATDAQLNRPRGLAIDDRGNLFITDRDNNSVRMVDAHGIITTMIGGGRGYRGDGGAARRAAIWRPRGMGFDADGNLHVADRNNHAIRKIDRRGVITTVAGGNGPGLAGDGGSARRALLNYPSGIVFDRDGNAFVSDHMNHAVRKIDRGGVITTVVGGHGAGYSGDGGAARDAQLDYPSGLALDDAGNLYIADRNNDVVRMVAAIAAGGEPLRKSVAFSGIPPARGWRGWWRRRGA